MASFFGKALTSFASYKMLLIMPFVLLILFILQFVSLISLLLSIHFNFYQNFCVLK